MKLAALDREKRCSFCIESDRVRRSHFRLYDASLRLLGFRPYRCMICFRRFYSFCAPWVSKHLPENLPRNTRE